MTTIQKVIIKDKEDKSIYFCTSDEEYFIVSDYNEGVATIKPLVGESFITTVQIVVGCFEEGSNFNEHLLKAFNCAEETVLSRINFEFNGNEISISRDDVDKMMSYQIEEHNSENEVHNQIEEIRNSQTQNETKEKIDEIDKLTVFETKDEASSKLWNIAQGNSGISKWDDALISYARRWAKYMQYLMKENNKTLEEVAEQASIECDYDGITGYMYDWAVDILEECWKYGKELREWNNSRFQKS